MWTLEIPPPIKTITQPWVMDNDCVKYYQDSTWQWGLMACTRTLGMCVPWPWPWRYDLGSWSLHHIWSRTTILWNIIIQIQHCNEELWPHTDFGYMCTMTLTLEIWSRAKVMTHPWVMDNSCAKYYPGPTWQWNVIALTRILGNRALWPWPWRYDLRSKSWHILWSWTTIVGSIIQIQHGSEESWPGHLFWVCVHIDRYMTKGKIQDTPFSHGQ